METKHTVRIIIHLTDGTIHDHKEVTDVVDDGDKTMCFFTKENGRLTSYVYNSDKVLFYKMIRYEEENNEDTKD